MRLVYIAIFYFIICCKSYHESKHTKSIKYLTYEYEGDRDVKVAYILKVPKGYKLTIVSGSHEKEFQFIYPDSSIIYITNNSNSGSYLNYENVVRQSSEIYKEQLLKDTLYLEGLQEDSRYWKETKLSKIVVGYINTPLSKKKIFDEALSSIQRK
jgi:hypothetical protein